MKIILLTIITFSFFSFAEDDQVQIEEKSPYKIIGTACLPADIHCEAITSGPYKGYFLKSNVAAESKEFKNIRINMFALSVLRKETKKKEQEINTLMSDLNTKKQQCLHDNEALKNSSLPYKVIGCGCLLGDLYCKAIASGSYNGYYVKSNVSPDSEEFNKIRGNMFTKCALDRETQRKDFTINSIKSRLKSLDAQCTINEYNPGDDEGPSAADLSPTDRSGQIGPEKKDTLREKGSKSVQ